MANNNFKILIAEDDDDDFFLACEALDKIEAEHDIARVINGENLLDYLLGKNGGRNNHEPDFPDLILLDINMPKMSGLDVLKKIKGESRMKKISWVVLTSSNAKQDILDSYELGAHMFVHKSSNYDLFQKNIIKVCNYLIRIRQTL